MTANPRWKHRPEGSTWGDFGPDDELGRLNLLTPERVLRAKEEIREGRVFNLCLPLDFPGGNVVNARRHPPVLEPTGGADKPRFNYPLRLDDPRHIDVGCDDRVTMTLQYSSQWDAFSHMGQYFDADGDGVPEIRYYNGWQGNVDVVGPVEYGADGSQKKNPGHAGARHLGIEKFAEKGVVGRGVMIDLEKHFGRARHLVTHADLMRVMAADRVVVEEGDLVFFYTGFADVILEMNKAPDGPTLARSCAVLDGRDDALLQWVTDSGAVSLIADNYAVEQSPSRPMPGERFANSPLHQHCLFKLGVPLGEMWYLTELARWLRTNGRSRFFMTGQPLRLPGAVGFPLPVGRDRVMPIDKRVADIAAALEGIGDGATIMLSGFGGSGVPNALISALVDHDAKDIVLISNTAGHNGSQIARLVATRRVAKVIASSARGRGNPPAPFEVLWTQGKIELELVAQGSFAERIRAGGAGIPAFYTPAGLGTDLTRGKEVRRFDGRDYVLETALTADFTLLRAERADRYGNLSFIGVQSNFGPAMAAAGRVTIAEVAEVSEQSLPPDRVGVPGIYVQRVIALPDLRP